MDLLEEDLTCSVCYSLFCDPRVLPCSHTFCRTCLDLLRRSSTDSSILWPHRLSLKCPNCRSVAELTPLGVDALPTNVSLRAIVEKYRSSCEPKLQSCPEHPRQPLNVYCVQDQQLICGLCLTVGRHRGHAIDDLQVAFERERQTPALLLAELSDSRWSQVCELGQQLEEDRSRSEELVKRDRLEVAQYFEALEATLASKKQAFLDAVDQAAADVSQAFEPLIDRVKELQEEHLDLVSLGSSLEEEGQRAESPLAFLEKVHLLRRRVKELTSTPLPLPVKLSASPPSAHFLRQHWASVTVGLLEEAPVPLLGCCTQCGRTESDVDGSAARRWRHLVTVAVLLLMLVIGGASLGFSRDSNCSRLVHSLTSDLVSSLWDSAHSAWSVIGANAERWASELWSNCCFL